MCRAALGACWKEETDSRVRENPPGAWMEALGGLWPLEQEPVTAMALYLSLRERVLTSTLPCAGPGRR